MAGDDVDEEHQAPDGGATGHGNGNSAAQIHAAERMWRKRLRTFSGRRPTPSSEPDHESWDLQATQLLDEPGVTDQVRRQLLIQSLAQPALGVARSLGREASPDDIVDVIRVSYGSTADGHSLLLKFYSALQGEAEASSTYLQRLQATLRKVIEAKGTTEDGSFSLLVGQFCRGSHDEDLIRDLDLKKDEGGHTSFCALLKSFKEEELSRREKRDLLAARGGQAQESKKVKARNAAATVESSPDVVAEMTKAFAEMSKSLEAKIDARFATMSEGATSTGGRPMPQNARSGSHSEGAGSKPNPVGNFKNNQQSHRRKAVFCYRCGVDGHIRSKCENPPNPQLVFSRLNPANPQGN